jgi:hypothetical protein
MMAVVCLRNMRLVNLFENQWCNRRHHITVHAVVTYLEYMVCFVLMDLYIVVSHTFEDSWSMPAGTAQIHDLSMQLENLELEAVSLLV